ncbi:MCE family protein [Actinomadura barringtoniae]|uniref:MCE family protein n=1 Tax=Actinomadura barringtoniae TaxID=1427535 RepID=A0A939T363_9ACTN|nr:MCE family protein [Actinomadura barringtoniae]MBO2446199.1 MCE family protein [Actinomadura barringtoniae]
MLLGLVLAVTGCSIKTAGAPKGDLTLTAKFTDVQGLVQGHSVQMSDVKVGTVTKVELDKADYTSKVTMSIKNGIHIPQGSRAEIKITSLLGENYVDLQLPPGGRMDQGPFLASGAQIPNTSVQPAFEEVVGQAGPLLKALSGNDVAAVVNAGATALDGEGGKLNTAIAKSGDLIKVFADQREQLGKAVDDFARLGNSLAKGSDALNQAPVELERTTKMLRDDKDKILNVVAKLTRAARELNDKVLEGRVSRFKTLLNDLDPVLAQLGNNRQRLTGLVNGLVTFSDKLPKASYDGQLLLYPILKVTWPDGSPIFPTPGGKGGKTNAPQVPKDARNALPDLDKILGGGR